MIKPIPLALAALATTTMLAGTAAVAQTAPEMTRQVAEERANAAFARLDANEDGQLNEADREAQARKRFEAADTDGNGQLSFAEVTAMHDARKQMRDERRQQRAERGEGRRGAMQSGRAMRMMGGGDGPRGGRMLERADTDNNGSVSQAEFTAQALARFDRIDADSDGTISADERRASRQGRGERGEHRRMMRQAG